MQHITFNEWLPAALGRSVLKATGLMLEPTGFCDGYDESVDPSILNEFHSAAFRLHTLVQDGYHMIDRQLRKREFIRMRRLINNPTTLYQSGAINQLTTGLLSSKAQASDNVIVEEVLP